MNHNELRDIRLRMGLRQNDFCSLMGVSQSTIVAWETGTSTPNQIQLTIYHELKRKLDRDDTNAETLRNTLIGIGILGFLIWLFSNGEDN